MNLNIIPTKSAVSERILFKLKPLRKDGLLLNIHPKVIKSSKNVRFTIAAFHTCSKVLAVADNNNNLYVIDYGLEKFWKLPPDPCISMKFSTFNNDHLFVGLVKGSIKIVNFETGCTIETLKGHKVGIKTMSFAKKYLFLSSSEEEAILWDLRTYTMLQVLDLDKKSFLKHCCFIPMSCNILSCFQDDVIQIWNAENFSVTKNFSPKNWRNFLIKSITFTKNGQVMVIAGYTAMLAFVLLNNWNLFKFADLTQHIQSVRHVEFVPQPFDAGFNKMLAILSQQGKIYFYNIDKCMIINELKLDTEIRNFSICSEGNYVVCLLHCGNTALYDLHQYVMENDTVKPEKVSSKKRKLITAKDQKQSQRKKEVTDEVDSLLNRDKLKAILETYGEYPESFRFKIWEHLLELPNNYKCFNTIINRVTSHSIEDLIKKYPLENRISLIALKKLLSNLVTWCQFFSNVEFLPVFVYPFAKVFQNKPVACFETICTIILNWCQHWFEYYPLAPFNILAIIENILYEHDPELLNFFTSLHLSSTVYAWPLLSSAFSEVLSCSEWLQFWDHVFTNEVSFLLCATAAYNIAQKEKLMKMRSLEEFKCFYENQNPVDMKKMLKTTHFLLTNLKEETHPRQYLKDFKGIGTGTYPKFMNYPLFLFDLQEDSMVELEKDLIKSIRHKNEILMRRKKEERKKLKADQKSEEHKRRIIEMEKAALETIKSKDNLLKLVSNKLESMQSCLSMKEEASNKDNLS